MGKLREKLAELEHKQWAHWTEYMLDVLSPLIHKTGRDGPTHEEYARAMGCWDGWRRQIATPYAELTEKEKDSDREWADEVLKVISKDCVEEQG